ncbi:MAG: hypothetical protein HFH42_04005 [Lachnospiraceae bacterium]|nr:hypothetical protein [Lachnospiraceae bacterium]
MNKYYKMIGHIHMPEEKYEQLKTELVERAAAEKAARPIWRRYAMAAAFALCLFGTVATAYAAARYQWFGMFFENSGKEQSIEGEYIAKASTEKVAAQDENYKFTVLSHLCSKEQQMGLILCSFQFLNENSAFLAVQNRDRDEVTILKKDEIIYGPAALKEEEDSSETALCFRVGDGSMTRLLSAGVTYYADEFAEDGGYLLGIRYSFAGQDARKEGPGLNLSLENAGDMMGKLKVSLPESEEVESIRFVSEDKPEDYIVISPIGMTLSITAEKASHPNNTFDHGIMDSLKLIMENEENMAEEIGKGYETSVLQSTTDTMYTWYVHKEFTNLTDVSKIKHIELDGNKYVK